MSGAYECFACSKVAPIVDDKTPDKCSCGSSNGRVISAEEFRQRFAGGAIWNIDPKTGKPAKNKT